MNLTKNYNVYLLAIVLALVINLYSWHLPFFWDTILTSTITQHFYDYGFQYFISPAHYDAGHPPLFYVYVTCFYHIFGKNLMAAHLSVLPFTILGIVSFIQLLEHFSFSGTQQIIAVVLFFAIPAVITQNTLVSYDVVLLSLYLAALMAFLKDKKIVFLFLIIGIAGVSLRGLFCILSLSVSVYCIKDRNFKEWFRWNLYFIPSLLLIGSWYYYHYLQTGWLFATNATGWSHQRGIVDMHGFFKNGISVLRCFFDLGIVILSFLSLFYFIQKRKADKFTLLWLIPAIIFSVSFLPFSNPINHRYFLIVYVLMLFPVIRFLSGKKNIFTVFTTLILLSGHFQIYPVPISNGWDCTLLYTSYVSAKDDFDNLNARGFHIDKSKAGTVFPLYASLQQTNMLSDTTKMINVHDSSIDSIPYVLFSNVGDDFSDEQIEQLKKWSAVAQFDRKQVAVILYKNPKK